MAKSEAISLTAAQKFNNLIDVHPGDVKEFLKYFVGSNSEIELQSKILFNLKWICSLCHAHNKTIYLEHLRTFSVGPSIHSAFLGYVRDAVVNERAVFFRWPVNSSNFAFVYWLSFLLSLPSGILFSRSSSTFFSILWLFNSVKKFALKNHVQKITTMSNRPKYMHESISRRERNEMEILFFDSLCV